MTVDRPDLASAALPVGIAAVLAPAAAAAGLSVADAELIRAGSNTLVGLGGEVVARIGPEGSIAAAERQIAVARWLHDAGISATAALGGVAQPVLVAGRPVTWWRRIPAHRHATPAELGRMLRGVHALPPPEDPRLPELDPFDGLDNVIDGHGDASGVLTDDEQRWWRDRVTALRSAYQRLLPRLRIGVIHGDAWQGNVVVPCAGGDPVLVDLDHVGIGPQEWDLVPIAADHVDFARISAAEYHEFAQAAGGIDIITSPCFELLAAITELRWAAFTVRRARHDDGLRDEVQHRLRCLRGMVPKPWTWTAS